MALRVSTKDPAYFKNYAGSGKSYNRVWAQYSYAKEVVALLKKHKIKVRRILVLGAATGKIIPILEKGFGAKCWGCEINTWAHAQIPLPQRRRIQNIDMRDYVKLALKQGKHFDLVFSNSLIYLPKRDLPAFLKRLSPLCTYLHFQSSLKGAACPDPYRQTLEKYVWWVKIFRRAHFYEWRQGRKRTYLWTNQPVKSED